MNTSAEILTVVLSGKPHVWCQDYGWHDAATHDDEPLVTREVRVTPLEDAPARYLCKACGGESPAGIGYAVTCPGPLQAPRADCPHPHA